MMIMQNAILVIEDDIFIVNHVYREILPQLSSDVHYAFNKAEALDLIRQHTYRILIIDIMLNDDPYDVGGLDIIEHVNRNAANSRIVVVSATDDIKVALKAYKIEISAFLLKGDIKTHKDILDPLNRIIKNDLNWT